MMCKQKTIEKLTPKERYNRAIETRNFEIEFFWKRSGYFTVLNASIAVGFFSLLEKESNFSSLGLAVFGFLVSLIWLNITFGSKYWQVRWEEVSKILEKEVLEDEDISLFSSPREMYQNQVKNNLKGKGENSIGWIKSLYQKCVLTKPSVSMQMTYLACLFMLFWFAAVLLAIYPFLSASL